MERMIVLAIIAVIAQGCVSLDVSSVKDVPDNKAICIVDNSSVRQDFRDALERRLQAVGFKTEIVDHLGREKCGLVATYAATFGFHWGTYLATANIKVFSKEKVVGEASYRAPYASPEKHGRVENKIEKMVAELFKG